MVNLLLPLHFFAVRAIFYIYHQLLERRLPRKEADMTMRRKCLGGGMRITRSIWIKEHLALILGRKIPFMLPHEVSILTRIKLTARRIGQALNYLIFWSVRDALNKKETCATIRGVRAIKAMYLPAEELRRIEKNYQETLDRWGYLKEEEIKRRVDEFITNTLVFEPPAFTEVCRRKGKKAGGYLFDSLTGKILVSREAKKIDLSNAAIEALRSDSSWTAVAQEINCLLEGENPSFSLLKEYMVKNLSGVALYKAAVLLRQIIPAGSKDFEKILAYLIYLKSPEEELKKREYIWTFLGLGQYNRNLLDIEAIVSPHEAENLVIKEEPKKIEGGWKIFKQKCSNRWAKLLSSDSDYQIGREIKSRQTPMGIFEIPAILWGFLRERDALDELAAEDIEGFLSNFKAEEKPAIIRRRYEFYRERVSKTYPLLGDEGIDKEALRWLGLAMLVEEMITDLALMGDWQKRASSYLPLPEKYRNLVMLHYLLRDLYGPHRVKSKSGEGEVWTDVGLVSESSTTVAAIEGAELLGEPADVFHEVHHPDLVEDYVGLTDVVEVKGAAFALADIGLKMLSPITALLSAISRAIKVIRLMIHSIMAIGFIKEGRLWEELRNRIYYQSIHLSLRHTLSSLIAILSIILVPYLVGIYFLDFLGIDRDSIVFWAFWVMVAYLLCLGIQYRDWLYSRIRKILPIPPVRVLLSDKEIERRRSLNFEGVDISAVKMGWGDYYLWKLKKSFSSCSLAPLLEICTKNKINSQGQELTSQFADYLKRVRNEELGELSNFFAFEDEDKVWIGEQLNALLEEAGALEKDILAELFYAQTISQIKLLPQKQLNGCQKRIATLLWDGVEDIYSGALGTIYSNLLRNMVTYDLEKMKQRKGLFNHMQGFRGYFKKINVDEKETEQELEPVAKIINKIVDEQFNALSLKKKQWLKKKILANLILLEQQRLSRMAEWKFWFMSPNLMRKGFYLISRVPGIGERTRQAWERYTEGFSPAHALHCFGKVFVSPRATENDLLPVIASAIQYYILTQSLYHEVISADGPKDLSRRVLVFDLDNLLIRPGIIGDKEDISTIKEVIIVDEVESQLKRCRGYQLYLISDYSEDEVRQALEKLKQCWGRDSLFRIVSTKNKERDKQGLLNQIKDELNVNSDNIGFISDSTYECDQAIKRDNAGRVIKVSRKIREGKVLPLDKVIEMARVFFFADGSTLNTAVVQNMFMHDPHTQGLNEYITLGEFLDSKKSHPEEAIIKIKPDDFKGWVLWLGAMSKRVKARGNDTPLEKYGVGVTKRWLMIRFCHLMGWLDDAPEDFLGPQYCLVKKPKIDLFHLNKGTQWLGRVVIFGKKLLGEELYLRLDVEKQTMALSLVDLNFLLGNTSKEAARIPFAIKDKQASIKFLEVSSGYSPRNTRYSFSDMDYILLNVLLTLFKGNGVTLGEMKLDPDLHLPNSLQRLQRIATEYGFKPQTNAKRETDYRLEHQEVLSRRIKAIEGMGPLATLAKNKGFEATIDVGIIEKITPQSMLKRCSLKQRLSKNRDASIFDGMERVSPN
ncbi:MAG: hypothetical protein MSIBF_06410 [Candidatus Altiarchaeales archaeon IMC4]|nr:MAG: hypothetical protein MSIBF_06410 [Candidatus Altiarchaeales archaeon IMC4]